MTTTDLPPGASTKPAYALNLGAVSASAKTEDKPDCKSQELLRDEPKWRLGDLLLGGTEAMRAARTDVLAKEGDETDEEYIARLQRAVLTNYYKNTITTHAALPFATPVEVDGLSEQLEYLHEDADGTGRSLTTLTRDHLFEAMHRRRSFVLVDVPPGNGETQADVMQRRPRILTISAADLLGRTCEITKDGESLCTYARIRQVVTEKVGQFGEREVEQILVIQANRPGTPGYTVRYRKAENGGDWVPDDPQPYSMEWVPLFETVTGDEPPYLPLAELNVAHWQSDADQRACLAFGRLQTVWATGWEVDRPERAAAKAAGAASGRSGGTTKFTLGPKRRIINPAAEAKIGLLETNGQPLTAGREDLADLERRMERFGAAQLASQMGGVTATSRKLDDARDRSNLAAWVVRTEHTMLQALRACHEWRRVTPSADLAFRISREFDPAVADPMQMPTLLQMRAAKEISREAFLKEAKSRKVLSGDFDIEADAALLEAEGTRQAEAEMAALATVLEQQRQQQDMPQDGTKPMHDDEVEESPADEERATVGAP